MAERVNMAVRIAMALDADGIAGERGRARWPAGMPVMVWTTGAGLSGPAAVSSGSPRPIVRPEVTSPAA